MARNLPPLVALRAFEAAARNGSFVGAAQELSITPAAVSQQVRYLEERLKVSLFIRHTRSIESTPIGAEYAAALGIAFDQIAAASERVRVDDHNDRLTIATTPSFAAQWLMPRLIRFQNQHPELDVRLSTSNALADFARHDVDVAVRYGMGEWSGLSAELLLRTEHFPVCSPALLNGQFPLKTPSDLRHQTMLHLMVDEWTEWLVAAGVGELVGRRGPQYSDAGLLTQAASEGHGVALGQWVLVADDLAAGRLVEPFALRIPSDHAYYVVAPSGSLDRPKVLAFRRWLQDEATRPRIGS